MPTLLSTYPSDPKDPRFMRPSSPDCPNNITDEPETTPPPAAGRCGSCAWGFYTDASSLPQPGEDASLLSLTRVHTADGKEAGYTSRCGLVAIFKDQYGRVGALRGKRFFPGITDNWAFKRFLERHGIAEVPS